MEQRRAIERQRDRLLTEIEALRNKVAGLEMALSLMGAELTPTDDRSDPKRPRAFATRLPISCGRRGPRA